MILGYFGDDPDAGLRSLLQAPVGPGGMVSAGGDAPLPRSLRIEGVTLLSAGGYGCAALRVWGDELLDPATRPDGRRRGGFTGRHGGQLRAHRQRSRGRRLRRS